MEETIQANDVAPSNDAAPPVDLLLLNNPNDANRPEFDGGTETGPDAARDLAQGPLPDGSSPDLRMPDTIRDLPAPETSDSRPDSPTPLLDVAKDSRNSDSFDAVTDAKILVDAPPPPGFTQVAAGMYHTHNCYSPNDGGPVLKDNNGGDEVNCASADVPLSVIESTMYPVRGPDV